MIIYGIEDYERKKRKKWIIIVIIAILVIGMSIFGGIKMAEYVSNAKSQILAENGDGNQEEENTDNKQQNNEEDNRTATQARSKPRTVTGNREYL